MMRTVEATGSTGAIFIGSHPLPMYLPGASGQGRSEC